MPGSPWNDAGSIRAHCEAGLAGKLGIRVLLAASIVMGFVTCHGRRDAPNLYRRHCADCHGVGAPPGEFRYEFWCEDIHGQQSNTLSVIVTRR